MCLQVSLYQSPEDRAQIAAAIPYTAPQVMEYISYARGHCSPVISDEVRTHWFLCAF
jgi:DNA replicative helicase MCM subunit Mcm2 (Cdc46/Mcm family)